MQQWIADCIGMRLADRVRYHPARSGTLADLVRDVSPDRLMDFSQRLASARRTIDHPLNQRLMFESLFLAYCDAVRTTDAIAR
jgi:DNA polymerase III subunit delta'